MKLEFSPQISEIYSNINFHENLSSGSRVVPSGRSDKQTDMMKLIVDFRDFENAPKNFPFWTVNEQQSTGIKTEIILRIFFSVTSQIKELEHLNEHAVFGLMTCK
jgi:hypothetical protein